MASMNNWLAFSLSPQELPSQNEQDQTQNSVSRLDFNSDEISSNHVSAPGHCSFDLSSQDSTLPHPFGILEAYNRNHHHSQDWNMKNGADTNSSMFMGDPCSGQNHDNQEPKLENFLGGHSFGGHEQKLAAAYNGDYMYANCSLQVPSDSIDQVPNAASTNNINGGESGGSTNSSIGLSMIKTWLRNQPTRPPLLQPENNKNESGGATTQTLALTMSSGGESSSDNLNNQQQQQDQMKAAVVTLDSQSGAIEAVPRKSIDTFGQRTSIYRGVTRHRWTGRYEAHLWDNSCRREGQTRKGRQVYLGGYDKEEKAARAYDLAALKYWGPTTTTNFPISEYEKELEEMKHMTRQEFIASLRRKSSGFSRGASIYRGVTRHHQHGRWQARIGRVAGNKDLYLGTFSTQEEAAEAYDIAAIKFRGLNAVTNFEINRYDVKSILESSTLPIGGAAKRLKDAEQADLTVDGHRTDNDYMGSQMSDVINYGWPSIAAYQQPQAAAAAAVFGMHHPYAQRFWCKQEQDIDNTGNHSYQDLQLGNTHNFFQPTAMHQNYMSMDSSLMENSSSSSSVVYGNGSGDRVQGNMCYGNAIPISTINMASDGNQNQGNGYGDGEARAIGYDNVYGSADTYQARNLYYLSQQQQPSPAVPGLVKASMYDQGSLCNTWVPTAVSSLASARSSNNMALVHGTPTFPVWKDT